MSSSFFLVCRPHCLFTRPGLYSTVDPLRLAKGAMRVEHSLLPHTRLVAKTDVDTRWPSSWPSSWPKIPVLLNPSVVLLAIAPRPTNTSAGDFWHRDPSFSLPSAKGTSGSGSGYPSTPCHLCTSEGVPIYTGENQRPGHGLVGRVVKRLSSGCQAVVKHVSARGSRAPPATTELTSKLKNPASFSDSGFPINMEHRLVVAETQLRPHNQA